MEKRPIKNKDDIFSTPVEHVYADDAKPENLLLDRSSYNYDLPENQIAQVPLEDRAASRMLVMDRDTGEYHDFGFRDLPSFLNPGDVLVVNNTKVIPARIFGLYPYSDSSTGEVTAIRKVELLLIRPEGDTWKVMLNEDLSAGTSIQFLDGGSATVTKVNDDGSYQLSFNEDVWKIIETDGHTPLPPYIKNQDELEEKGIAERYNTVYSKDMTSVAAPTAGLHFTEEILNQLKEQGVNILNVRLDVGLGTFRPVVVNDIRNHHMHTEHIVVSKDVITEINEARARGNKVIAVGTTSLRTLESIPESVWKEPQDFESDTGIFIYPGSGRIIKSVDGLFTNFHAPESTLMMLVSVVAGNGDDARGREHIMAAYKHAVDTGYRFMSLGDCMLII